jgi:hypothetical protein
MTTTTLALGDRVRMDTTPGAAFLGGTNPDLGVGIVTALTENDGDDFLMAGMYVGVDFPRHYERVAYAALIKVGE